MFIFNGSCLMFNRHILILCVSIATQICQNNDFVFKRVKDEKTKEKKWISLNTLFPFQDVNITFWCSFHRLHCCIDWNLRNLIHHLLESDFIVDIYKYWNWWSCTFHCLFLNQYIVICTHTVFVFIFGSIYCLQRFLNSHNMHRFNDEI